MDDHAARLDNEIAQLAIDIKRLGKEQDGVWGVEFGVLFDDDAVVGARVMVE